MVALRSELAGACPPISNRSFYEYFLNSLPRSLDLLVALYDSLCNRFSKYEMRIKPAGVRDGKTSEASGSSMALSSQKSEVIKGEMEGEILPAMDGGSKG